MFRINSAKQVARSWEKRGSPRAEWDRVRCDAIFFLASNRQSVFFRQCGKWSLNPMYKQILKFAGRLMNNAG